MRTERHPWLAPDLRRLAVLYPDSSTETLIQIFGRSKASIYQAAAKIGVKKSAAFHENSKLSGRFNKLTTSGIPYRFPKGHIPANKGMRRPGWAPGRMAQTQFKKGVRQGVAVKLWKPIGTERISKDGYLERKVNNDLPLQARWRAVHRIVWESVNGPVPRGHAVCFLPGKRTAERDEITIDRLELVTRAELMRRNTIHRRYPKPLVRTIQVLGQLNRRIREKEQGRGPSDRRPQKPPVRNAGGAARQGQPHGARAGKGDRRGLARGRGQRKGRGPVHRGGRRQGQRLPAGAA